MKLEMRQKNTQLDVDRVGAEWQFEIHQVAASMSMRLPIEGTASGVVCAALRLLHVCHRLLLHPLNRQVTLQVSSNPV
jgi:hypothetical protein